MATRVKQVVLSIMDGSLQVGFPVMLEIKADANLKTVARITGYLPGSPNLSLLLQKWQSAYHQLITPQFRLGAKSIQITNFSYEEIGSQLVDEYNNWLSSDIGEWQKIKNKLQDNLDESDEIIFIIETNVVQLQQLPWHLWNLILNTYNKLEIVLSIPEFQRINNLQSVLPRQINILSILGDSTGINTQQDKALLIEKFPKAKIEFLVEPQRKQLNDKLWSQNWDILFFAGHSNSIINKTSGQIYINQTDSLTIGELKYALKTAVQHGLKLAIFNSCDGLGLAREMLYVGIPYIIVMREPVPDRVAQEFLKYFLLAFAKNKSIYLAVREAREKLQGLEDICAYASWLPVIFQASTETPLTWESLIGYRRRSHSFANNWHKILKACVFSSFLVLSMRYFGILQFWELQSFDGLVRLRPKEKLDSRLLIITITENDIQSQKEQTRRGSLSDVALERILQKLEHYKPRVIGLDIYRDFSVESNYKSLAIRLRQSDRLIAVCKSSDSQVDPSGIAPPPEIPTERTGFSDFSVDPDNIVRRHLLAGTPEPTSPCTTSYAFSTKVAFEYLARLNIFPEYTKDGFLKLGQVIFKPLEAPMGAYQKVDTWGHQVLLNYRSARSPENIATSITLNQFLNTNIDPKAIEDRIVLIGTVANSFQDYWSSPYSNGQSSSEQMAGVLVQAQMISQITSAVLDRRPLLWILPFWSDTLWILSWSCIGGVIGWKAKSIRLWGTAIAGQLSLWGISFGLLVYSGCWISVIPSSLALGTSTVLVAVWSRSENKTDETNGFQA